jgi:hypothetical protein
MSSREIAHVGLAPVKALRSPRFTGAECVEIEGRHPGIIANPARQTPEREIRPQL